MYRVRISELSFQFRSDISLLDSISATATKGWYGLVGANGCGKSTLLRIIAGIQQADNGRILVEPNHLSLHYCEQELQKPIDSICQFAKSEAKEARILREQFMILPMQIDRWESLSSGEKKRWQVAAALFAQCDVLLLDEPANHLDAESRAILVAGLLSFPGIGILVSHDRELLDLLTENTWWLAEGKLETYAESYTAAKQLRETSISAKANAHEAAKAEVKKLERRLHQAREARASAERSQKVTPHDSDSRTLGAKTVKAWAESNLGKEVGKLRDATERARSQIPFYRPELHLGRSVFLDYEKPKQPTLLRLPPTDIYIQDTLLLHDVSFTWGRSDRIRIHGSNGAGKSTFLRYLLSLPNAPLEHLLVLPQEHGPSEILALIEEVRMQPPHIRGRICSLLAALGASPQILSQTGNLSPGEARKLHIALGLGKHVWGVILDEPTNHLDLPSVERLEKALQAFPGAILLVSHDERFARSCTTRQICFQDGRCIE